MSKYIQLKDGNENVYPRPFSNVGLTSSDDLNNVIGHGVFCWCNNVRNKPSDSGTFGYLFVPNEIGFQLYFPFGTNGSPAMYVRYYTNSQWYPWRKVTLSVI